MSENWHVEQVIGRPGTLRIVPTPETQEAEEKIIDLINIWAKAHCDAMAVNK